MKPVIVKNITLHFDIADNVQDVSEETKSLIKKINEELDKIEDRRPQISLEEETEIIIIDLI